MTEGEDFYFNEQGLMVLTEKYHLRRGYCCGNGCRHCPYEYDNVPEPAREQLIERRRRDKEKFSPPNYYDDMV